MIAIVAVDRSWGIGRDGGLLFRLPSDMKRFRALTSGGTVLMGRRTLDSFPGGNPLPNRRNVVLTSETTLGPGVETVHSPEELAAAAAGEPEDRVFVIGGGSVYAALLSRCRYAYVTKVDSDAPNPPDTYFPNLDKLCGWKILRTSEPVSENGVTYRFVDYVNTKLCSGPDAPEGTR